MGMKYDILIVKYILDTKEKGSTEDYGKNYAFGFQRRNASSGPQHFAGEKI